MTFIQKLTFKSRITLSIGLIASIAMLAALLFPAGAATSNNNRVDFADGQSVTVKGNATVKNGAVEFGATNATTTTKPATTTTGTPSTPTGKFNIVGNQIVDPKGNIFVPIGANVAVRERPSWEYGYVYNKFGTANDKVEQVKAWGWNTVRVNTSCSPDVLSDLYGGLDDLIYKYTVLNKIVVMIDCHSDVTNQNVDYSNATVQQVMSFFDVLTKKYAGNPYVWFNTVNEPSSTPYSATQWVNLQSSLLARVRQNAPNNIFVADLPAGGNAINAVTSGAVTSVGNNKCNVLYSWHAYGFVGSNSQNAATSDADHKAVFEAIRNQKLPVIIGEFGDPLNQDGSPATTAHHDHDVAGVAELNRLGSDATLKYALNYGVGLLWWHATGDSGNHITYSLTKTMESPWNAISNQSILSSAGQRMWNLSHPAPAVQKFTGNIADSHCS